MSDGETDAFKNSDEIFNNLNGFNNGRDTTDGVGGKPPFYDMKIGPAEYGYHKKKIAKGKIGEYSKIKEEFEELTDAVEQKNKILILCELSDLIGSIEEYAKSFGMTLNDIKEFSDLTKKAFKDGSRK